MKQECIIDGSRFHSRGGFFGEVDRVMIRWHSWGHNLDAFNDVLRGGFGTPDEGFVIRWIHSDLSRKRLGKDFDTIVEIIRDHGPNGEQAEDGIDLILE